LDQITAEAPLSCDAANPGAEVVTVAEGVQAAKDGEEDLLGDVIHVVQIVRVAGEVTAQRQAVDAHNLAKGVPVAPGDLIQDERDFGRFEHLPPTMLYLSSFPGRGEISRPNRQHFVPTSGRFQPDLTCFRREPFFL
jgi:hypothetical protein